jgi:hypothetical protein
MRLGVSYNIFDGEELLEGSIKQIRSHVDYVSVVFQTISNFGNQSNPELIPLLERLKSEGLIDELYHYSPKIDAGGHHNEMKKRTIGLMISEGAKCTHHMSMDSDEYYIPSEFENIKKLIEDNDFDASYCQMKTYYKTSEFVLDPPEDYYVSLIFKINRNSTYVMGGQSPVLVDPTRRMMPFVNPIVLTRNLIEMHHMSFVRKSLLMKLNNSSSKMGFNDKIPTIVNHYENWLFPNKVMWASGELLNVKQVKNDFNVKF